AKLSRVAVVVPPPLNTSSSYRVLADVPPPQNYSSSCRRRITHASLLRVADFLK
ncbi:hypothetical protein SOVF_036440, partial [Spinacia oleracea]